MITPFKRLMKKKNQCYISFKDIMVEIFSLNRKFSFFNLKIKVLIKIKKEKKTYNYNI